MNFGQIIFVSSMILWIRLFNRNIRHRSIGSFEKFSSGFSPYIAKCFFLHHEHLATIYNKQQILLYSLNVSILKHAVWATYGRHDNISQ